MRVRGPKTLTVNPEIAATLQGGKVMKVFIVQAEHAYVPGQPMTAHATKASANREAASLVNIMLKDCGKQPFASATSWKRGLQECNKTREDPHGVGDTYDIWITELEVKR